MAHLHQNVHAEATGLAAEEKYVASHAAAVDRTINSREFKLGTLSYVETGHVPADKFWAGLAKQEAKNPTAFDLKNPSYAGFFTSPAKLGELPSGNVIFDVMQARDQSQHSIFAAHHSFYVGLVDRSIALANLATSTPALTTGTSGTGAGSTTAGGSTTGGSASGGSTESGPSIGTGSASTSLGGPGDLAPSSVPEPASGLMFAAGLMATVAIRKALGRRKG